MPDEEVIQFEWRVTTIMPKWIFEDSVASGQDIRQAINSFLSEQTFVHMIRDEAFDHVEAEVVEILIHE